MEQRKRQRAVDQSTMDRLWVLWLWCHYWPEVRKETWASGVRRIIPEASVADAFLFRSGRVFRFLFAPIEWLR